MWNEWNEVQAVRNSSNSREQQVIQWQRPQQNWFKCNVDASFHHDIGKTSMGWCVRDSLGRFVLAGSIWINGMCTVNEGEALAILEAMKELHTRGYTNVTFETDSQIVANAIYHVHSGVSEFSELICNIRNLLSNHYDFEVKSIKRQANMVAHKLARAAISRPRRCIFELIPTCIEQLIFNEMI
jgi:ribonuclease HI